MPKNDLNRCVPFALRALNCAGWMTIFGMLTGPGPLGGLTAFGPGMQLIDMVRLHVFHDFNALLDAAALCSFQLDRSPFVVVAEIGVMWLAMVGVMVLPSWACGGNLVKMWPEVKAGCRIGMCTALLCLCVAGALVQICAQGLGVLSAQLRVTELPVQAVFLLSAALLHILRGRLAKNPDTLDAGTDFSNGFFWMIRGVWRCVPMLLLMFPLGLMNVFAMVVMGAAMGLVDMYKSALSSGSSRAEKLT